MGAHDDQVRILLRGQLQDFRRRLADAHGVAHRARVDGDPLVQAGQSVFGAHARGGIGGPEANARSITFKTVSSPYASSTMAIAWTSVAREDGEKSTAHNTRRNDPPAPAARGGMVSSRHGVACSTASVTEPSTTRDSPFRPWVAMTMRSAAPSRAACRIWNAGTP